MSEQPPYLAGTLSLAEAAAYLGVHRDTITRWSDKGALRHSITPSGRRRYTKADLDSALKRHEPAA